MGHRINRGRLLLLAGLAALACGGSTEPADPTAPASIALATDTLSIYPGPVWRTAMPVAKVYNSAHQVIEHGVVWTSADPAIAIVVNNGVQGVAVGTATFTATAGSASKVAHVTVIREPVSSVIVSLVNPTYLYADDSVVLTGIAYGPALDPLPDRVVTITAHEPDIATITAAGMIHIHSSGTARFFFASEGVSDSVTIFADARRVARITIVPESVQLVIGQDPPQWSCHMFDASNADLGNRPITWSSSDTLVTQPSYCGAIPIGVGQAVITGRADTASAHVQVTVTAAP